MSIRLEIECETEDDARLYLNAVHYHNLITDIANALRTANKHGGDVQKTMQVFESALYAAGEHHLGPY